MITFDTLVEVVRAVAVVYTDEETIDWKAAADLCCWDADTTPVLVVICSVPVLNTFIAVLGITLLTSCGCDFGMIVFIVGFNGVTMEVVELEELVAIVLALG